MKLHWDKHHRGYVTNLNAALEKYLDAEKKRDVAAMIQLQSAIRFNGRNRKKLTHTHTQAHTLSHYHTLQRM
jgi:superoxide dismutase